MKQGHWPASLSAMGFLAGFCGLATAGPLIDPFLEEFQVGRWAELKDVALEGTYPADLLAPVRVDTMWVEAAARILDAPADSPLAKTPTRRLLAALVEDPQVAGWSAGCVSQLRELQEGPGLVPLGGDSGTGPVGMAVLGRRFFAGLAGGDTLRALGAADALVDAAAGVSGNERERFVWDLRRRRVAEAAGLAHLPPAGEVWPFLLELGPFDANAGWAMWTAHRSAANLPVLAGALRPEPLAKFLAGLRDPWLNAAELQAAGLPADLAAGLGAILLSGRELQAHFRQFPDPPRDFTAQGWWVKGRRGQVHGQASAYEQLALRADLHPAWRWDLWRRASELRLLSGQWSEGLQDLRQALVLSAQGTGAPNLSLRLRQWTEQALALATARQDTQRAQEIRSLAVRYFPAPEADTFTERVSRWGTPAAMPDGAQPPRTGTLRPAGRDVTRAAEALVGAGHAPRVSAADPATRTALQDMDPGRLWEPWVRWGRALTVVPGDSLGDGAGERPGGPREYGAQLRALARDPAGSWEPDRIIAAIGQRLKGRPEVRPLLDEFLFRDAAALAGGALVNRPSAIPALAGALKGSPIDLHALLGAAMVLGDMRGILAVAVLLPDGGLAPGEKLLFLYPLPVPGPLLDALLAAASDPALLLAVARNESLFEPAVRSRAGALGWMQIMPFHFPGGAAVPGAGHWSLPAVSIAKGDRLLEENRIRFQGDPYRVLAAYNAGPEAALRWERQLGGPCPRSLYLAWIGYPETRHYVEKVLVDREIYAAILSGLIPEPTDR